MNLNIRLEEVCVQHYLRLVLGLNYRDSPKVRARKKLPGTVTVSSVLGLGKGLPQAKTNPHKQYSWCSQPFSIAGSHELLPLSFVVHRSLCCEQPSSAGGGMTAVQQDPHASSSPAVGAQAEVLAD